jgi:hypothetical protein
MANTFNEPTWTTAEEGESILTSAQKKAVAPFELTGIIVRLLQYQFSDANNIENPLLKTYLWNADDLQSKILIKPGFERDSRVKGKPALYVNREDAVGDNLGILRHVVVSDSVLTMNDPKYARHLQGKHIILCEGLTGGEAEALAWEAASRIMSFSPMLEDDFGVEVFDLGGIGKPALRAEDRETAVWATPVIINWQKFYTWQLNIGDIY